MYKKKANFVNNLTYCPGSRLKYPPSLFREEDLTVYLVADGYVTGRVWIVFGQKIIIIKSNVIILTVNTRVCFKITGNTGCCRRISLYVENVVSQLSVHKIINMT